MTDATSPASTPDRRDVLRAALGATLAGIGAVTPALAAAPPGPGGAPQAAVPSPPAAKLPIVDIHNHPYWLGHNPRTYEQRFDISFDVEEVDVARRHRPLLIVIGTIGQPPDAIRLIHSSHL